MPETRPLPYPLPAFRFEEKASEKIAPFLAQASVAFLLIVSILAPVINFSDDLPWFRVEQLALVPLGLIYLWLLLAGLARPIKSNPLFPIALVYCALISLSIFYGTFVLGHRVLFKDAYEIPKVILPLIFFTLGLEANLSEKWIRRILFYYSLAIIPVCLYAFAQWMNLGISQQLVPIYSGGWHDDGALAHYRRVYSTMGNPNLLGQLMTWSISFFTLSFLFRVGNRLFNLFLITICLVTLAMTGSRYGIIDTALAFLLIFLLSASVKKRRAAMIGLLLVLFPFFAWVVFTVAKSNAATLDRLQSLSNPAQTDSLRGRLDELWPEASKEFFESPILGHGSAKIIFGIVQTDSEYLDVLKQFGIIGFLGYIAFYIYPLRVLWRGISYRGRSNIPTEEHFPASLLTLQLSFIILVTALVMNFGMSTFYAAPIQGFFWLWIGIGVGVVYRFFPFCHPRVAGS